MFGVGAVMRAANAPTQDGFWALPVLTGAERRTVSNPNLRDTLLGQPADSNLATSDSDGQASDDAGAVMSTAAPESSPFNHAVTST